MSVTRSVVGWHRHRIPSAVLAVLGSRMGRYLAPQLRGRVTPRILDVLERDGWHVHRIGQAAYVHAPAGDHHLIFGVWARRAPAPSWADRLGQVSAGYRRRVERATFEQRWRRLARDPGGRFAFLLPWHRSLQVRRSYRFDGPRPSMLDQAAIDVSEHNHRVRASRGLERWTEAEARAAWGDR